MEAITRQMRRGELMAAAAMPQIVDGQIKAICGPAYRLKKRRHGVYAIYDGSRYVASTRTKDLKKAEASLRLFDCQDEARREGIVDARYADVTEICDYYLSQIPSSQKEWRRNAGFRLARLRPYIVGKRLWQLNGAEVEKAMEAMAKKGLARGSIEGSVNTMRMAIRVWCQQHFAPLVMPFSPAPCTPGRNRVLGATEQAMLLRWADGDEDYDRETGVWSAPRRRLTEREWHRRRMFGRLLRLGIGTGSRPGRHEGLAWMPSQRFGHIDIATGTLFRTPIGTPAHARKQAPPVVMGPALMEHVRYWREEDGPDALYVIRKFDGGPATRAAAQLFTRVLQMFGIEGLNRHTLRHTAITGMIAAGVPASVIASTVGISMMMLRVRYNHSDDRLVQHIGHAGLDALLTDGIRVLD